MTPNKIFKSIKRLFETREIRNRILVTAGLVLAFRLLAAIPLPGIQTDIYLAAVNNTSSNVFTNVFTLATGSRLDSPSLMAIGLGAYINASIIVQLLTSVIPKLEELQKEGENGRRVLSQITRILTVPLSAMQGYVVYTVISRSADASANTVTTPDGVQHLLSDMVANMTGADIALFILVITTGSLILMWLSELITERGIGNGSSIIIMAGILATLPGVLIRDLQGIISFFTTRIESGDYNAIISGPMIFLYFFIIGFVLMIAFITFMNEASRKITIQYARRVRGSETTQASFLPLKINQAGVMPVIFASSILTFPTIIAQLILGSSRNQSMIDFANSVINSKVFQIDSIQHIILYVILIVLFTFFYSFIVMKPHETAENLQKSGGFIPGIRPGTATNKYITDAMLRLAIIGAFFLSIIAVIPNIVRLIEQGKDMAVFLAIGGTSILIIVGVILDTMRQIRSLRVTQSYEMYK